MRGAGSGGVVRGGGTKVGTSFFVPISHFVLGMALTAAAPAKGAEPYTSAPASKGLLSELFHDQSRPPAKQEKMQSEAPPEPVSTVESEEVERQRHMNAWFRRVEVCDRLRMIADQNGNELLRDQANQLEERANEIYRLQTSRMPAPAQAPVAVLAADRENTSRVRPGPAARTSTTPLIGRAGSDKNWRQASSSPPRLGGSMDQREQAILNGTSMGEDRP